MNREQAVAESQKLKDEKDALKKELRQQAQIAHDTNEQLTLFFPPIAHKPTVVDWSSQWNFNGYVAAFGSELLLVDPGVDFYTRFSQAGLSVLDIRAIFLSHAHIDHCADLPLFIDMLLKLEKEVDLIVPQDYIDDVLPKYYREEIATSDKMNIISLVSDMIAMPKPKWSIIESMQCIPLQHSAPNTFGFKLSFDDEVLAYVSDTGYATTIETNQGVFSANKAEGDFRRIVSRHDTIKAALTDATTAIININDLPYSRHSLTHLVGWDVLDMLEGSSVQRLILQHIAPYNARGESSDELYKAFFADEEYTCIIPGRDITEITL